MDQEISDFLKVLPDLEATEQLEGMLKGAIKHIKDIVKEPKNKKVTRLKLKNPKFQKHIWGNEHGKALFLALKFEETGDTVRYKGDASQLPLVLEYLEEVKKVTKEKVKEFGDGFVKGVGVRYDTILDRHTDDTRFERALKQQKKVHKDIKEGRATTSSEEHRSSTMDALVRMQAGLGQRSIADKLDDPNRIGWDEYKARNKDKMDFNGAADYNKMIEFRKLLDAERNEKLSKGTNHKDLVKPEKKKKKRKHGDDDAPEDRRFNLSDFMKAGDDSEED